MSKRDPSGPVPGFEDEFTGTVGKEKRVHKTHFLKLPVNLKNTDFDTGFEWVKIGQKYHLIPKKPANRGLEPEVTNDV